MLARFPSIWFSLSCPFANGNVNNEKLSCLLHLLTLSTTLLFIYLFFLIPQHLTVIHGVIIKTFVSYILPSFRFQDECTNNETITNEFNKNDNGKDDDHANTNNIHSGNSDNIDNAKTHCKDINIVINQKNR